MNKANRQGFTNWEIQGEHRVVDGFDVIICKDSGRKYHIDISTLEKV
jgi:hypothetical protein